MKQNPLMSLVAAPTNVAVIPILKQSDLSEHSNQIAAYPLGSVGEQRLYDTIDDGVRHVQAPNPFGP